MSTDQEYWDACLIKTWRNAGTCFHAMQMFQSITNKNPVECNLLRFMNPGYPWNTGIRVFGANHLLKISERLWNQSPDKDILLLKKLRQSKYDSSKVSENFDQELNNLNGQYRRNNLKIGMAGLAYTNRNNDTNWGVQKGVRAKRAR